MKLLFLGTGAPEGNPSPFCDCENCLYVRKKKGKNIRLQASLLINKDLLIDFGPDVTRTFNREGLSMSKLKYVLVTHCHFDHFFPANFFFRMVGPRTKPVTPLHLYGPERMQERVSDWIFKPDEQQSILHTIEPYTSIKIGKYTVKTMSITQSDAYAGRGMCYIISDGKKTLLYAVDTYEFPQENWKAMKGYVFDTVILDETFGYKDPPGKDHHNIAMYLQTIERLKKEKHTKKSTKFYTQHMSHHNPPHDKLAKLFLKHHILVPYDGLNVLC
jgi:phosphoribosyl 1,2-cyclic phosphate phosphodiesterase